MSQNRSALRTAAVVERRPAAAAPIHRSPAAAAASPLNALQRRLGNQATQALIARSVAQPEAASHAPAVASSLPPRIQRSAVSNPNDPAEIEAVDTARKVMRMAEPPGAPAVAGEVPGGTVQRAASPAAAVPAATSVPLSGGSPLPANVRSFMEPRFGASFANVRVHTDAPAAQLSADLGAHAFTVGQHVYFGRDKFQPQSAGGRELIAHELTHTIQQGAAVQRSADTTVAQRSEPRVQRLGWGSVLEWVADKARYIPGFTLFTIVLGLNPITMAPVERSAANILRGLLELIPVTGPLLAQVLESHGVFARAGAWVELQVRQLGLVGGGIKAALDKFIASVSLSDIFLKPGELWETGKRIFTEPIAKLFAFASNLAADLIGFVREAILLPLARLAEGTRGYDLLKAVLGQDPITGQPVPRTPETLIGGFMKLIGQEEIWENLKKANAVARAWAWFQGALAGLMGFVRQVPGMIVATIKSLELTDFLLLPKAFIKVAGAFGGVIVQFFTWAGNTMWALLEIIFEVVSPQTLVYLRKTGAALRSILLNPLPFMGNLIRAAKLGLQNFVENFGTHLKSALIEWLTGSLPGVYIPKSFSLGEIVKFIFSVLGLTWANIRPKLVKVVGETAVKAMETGFDIVVTLVTQGPAAAWDKIQEHLANLKDAVIGGIVGMVTETVIKKAIPKLVAMLIPGAGFISAIITIWDTIMVFVEKLKTMAQVVMGFVDSIVAIAAGQIESAAKTVENSLVKVLSLAISFLAGFIGLGSVADKVMGVIAKVRAVVDKGIDALIAWIVKMAKSLFARAKAGVKALFDWAFSSRKFKDKEGKSHTLYVDAEDREATLVIASSPTPAGEFFELWLARQDAGFESDNKAKVATARKAIAAAEKQVAAIVKARGTGKEDKDLVPEQRKLLELNVAVCEALSALIDDDATLGKLKEKYLLEGLAGNYGAIPKPKGDSFTADHQPQAAVLEAAAEFDYFTESGEMAKRAAGRAKTGYAINLHFKRHTAGRTYGGKGSKTKEGFLQEVKRFVKKGQKRAEQRQIVVDLIKKEVDEDVKAMKKAGSLEENYPDIMESKSLTAQEKKTLVAEIGKRIDAGEDQIAAQDVDALAR